MIVGVVGSREGVPKEKVFEALDAEIFVECIVSGGAKGVDSFAEEWAKVNNVNCVVVRPVDPAKKLDYLFRNVEIIALVDKLLIFWDGSSRGTKFVIDYATARNKDFQLFKC